MTTLVTGATGFVGSALVRQLLDRDENVRVLTRPNSDKRNLEGLAVEIATGSLTDKASLQSALKGCQYLYHVAADYRLWAPDPKELYQANVDGSRDLMQAALDQGVERIVYTSSVATLGIHPDRTPANEKSPVTIENMIGHYKRSKFLAEAVVQKLIDQENLPAVIVNPSTPIGPRDIKPTPTGRMIRDAIQGKIPAFVDTGLNIVHVDDVAAGHILAMEKGKIGERYILGGTDMSLSEILTCLAKHVGRKPPKIKLPHNLLLPIAHVVEAVNKLIGGGEPLMTVDGIKMAKKFMYFSSEKAKKELGYIARAPELALTEAADWFLEEIKRAGKAN